MENIPADIIIYAVIAGILVFWLRNILGTRHGAERQRPNPFSTPPANSAPYAPSPAVKASTDNKPASNMDAALVQIALIDRSFDPMRFIDNAKDAFAIVVTSFADGDRGTLKDLLAPEVFKSFEGALDAREKAGQKAITEVLSVREADIIDAKLQGNQAFVTLRFKADETYALSDADGKTIAGNPDRVVTMTDVWTFTRDLKSTDPRWFVSETRDDVKEDDGMTLPEAGITV